MTNNSSRHHYIPVWFQQEFSQSGFWVYKKSTDQIVKNKRSPKSLFYGTNRNTTTSKGETTDILETRLFAPIDDRYSTKYSKITNKPLEEITFDDKVNLLIIVNSLILRNPIYDDEINSIFSKYDFSDLRYNIYEKDSKSPVKGKIKHEIMKDELFLKAQAVICHLVPFFQSLRIENEIIPNMDIIEWQYGKSLLSDVPFALNADNLKIDKINEFFFPLSTSRMAAYRVNRSKYEDGIIFFVKDLLLLKNAKEYVVCEDKEYLEKTLELYNKLDGEIDLQKFAFFYSGNRSGDLRS